MTRGTTSERERVVGRALDLGINYFDTSAKYGGGLSEPHLGETLQTLKARPIINTKILLNPADLDDIPRAVEKEVDASLRRLQVDRLDTVQLQNGVGDSRRIEPDFSYNGSRLSREDVFGRGGVLEGLERMREAGKVGFFQVPSEPLALMESGRFHSVLVGHNLLNPTAGRPPPLGFPGPDFGQTIDKAAAAGMGVVLIRVLALGAASGQAKRPAINTPPRQIPQMAEEYQQNLQRAKALDFLVHEGQSLAQAAIKFVLMKNEVSTALLGFATEEHVFEAAVCSGAGPLTPDELKKLEELYATDFGLAPKIPIS
jgi:aryl-alcohol dehydrogenase-like predicted oxidoreductase